EAPRRGRRERPGRGLRAIPVPAERWTRHPRRRGRLRGHPPDLGLVRVPLFQFLMLFNTAAYACFFIVFFLVYRMFPWTRNQKLWLILVASLYFYAGWDYRFIPLLVGTGYLDFTIARFIHKPGTSEAKRKLLVTLSVTM